jgi:hypothetical protein
LFGLYKSFRIFLQIVNQLQPERGLSQTAARRQVNPLNNNPNRCRSQFLLRVETTRAPAGFRFSNSAEQNQNQENQSHQAQSTAGVITPSPAVRPRRQRAEQHENEQH